MPGEGLVGRVKDEEGEEEEGVEREENAIGAVCLPCWCVKLQVQVISGQRGEGGGGRWAATGVLQACCLGWLLSKRKHGCWLHNVINDENYTR